MHMCDSPRIYPSLPEYTPLFQQLYATLPESPPPSQDTSSLFNNYNILRPSQNLPLPPRIYPPFQQLYYYATLPESTLPPRTHPSSTTLCDAPRIYPSFPEYTPLFNKCTCATLPESTPPSQNIPPFSTTIYATLAESTSPSHNIPPFPQLYYYETLPESTPPSQNILPFSTNLYVRPSQNLPLPPRIYPFFKNYKTLRPSQNLPLTPRIFFQFWERVVNSLTVTCSF